MLFGEFAKSQAEAEYPELWRGLIGAWSPCLSPRGGTVLRDLSGCGNHGTLTNMDPATDWVTIGGRLALDFDGTNDYVSLGTVYGKPSQFTIVCWAQFRAVGGNAVVFSDDSGGANNNAWGIYGAVVGSSRLSVYVSSGSSAQIANFDGFYNTTYYPSTRPVHMVATVSGSLISYYRDGIPETPVAQTVQNGGTAHELAIGRYGAYNGLYSNMILYGVRLYSQPWNAGLVALDYRLGPGGWATPRRRRWNYATAQTAIPYWVFARKNARLIGGGVS